MSLWMLRHRILGAPRSVPAERVTSSVHAVPLGQALLELTELLVDDLEARDPVLDLVAICPTLVACCPAVSHGFGELLGQRLELSPRKLRLPGGA
jgi:hypothetical protein